MVHEHYKDKKIGIWGFGKTGQSVLKFISPATTQITVFESAALSDEQETLLKQYNATLVPQNFLLQFLEYNDIIIPSPGVDLTTYSDWSDKFVSELTLFAQHSTAKTVAITGSVGKTTTVTLLTQLLNACGIKACAAGNIGTPLLDILPLEKNYDLLVLELSSFQLEQPHTFAPWLAALTNIFPNHLDRHKDLATYAQAKGQLFVNQTDTDWAIIPMEFLDACIPYTKNQKVMWLSQDAYKEYITSALSDITFTENWQIIFALLERIGIEAEQVACHSTLLHKPEHRFEFLGIHNGISFYNDSKATIPESTLKSVEQCGAKPIILFLGGLSKGVDRSSFIAQLPKTIISILCFGKEAATLHQLCLDQGFMSSNHATLEDAWAACKTLATAGDVVLFSPAGASYDLFKNYEERGTVFKKLVLTQ